MQEEEPSFQRYEFTFQGGINNSYLFETTNEVFYEIKFTPTPYLFENEPILSTNTYEFSIIVVYNPQGVSPVFDPKTSLTIAAIFTEFYEKNDKLITIYICDSSDGRQMVRKRKFDYWFQFFVKDDYVKYNDIIIDLNGERFPVSLIIKSENPHKSLIISSFIKIIEGYNTNK
jgi:hypothetical protein